uniref:Ig-like domain-containing protein n=1 Tax=Prevotella sp. TaxID=59823 RepID=UPI0040283817
MKKLCLILTVLYAIWANCSAQSLNIDQNLLEDNSSTFESGRGSWTCNDYGACSIASESGRNGNYLKLTNIGAVNDYDKQMEYSLDGHTPAKGTRYVIKFWAKRNGDSGNGKINVLLQKNEAGTWPQQAFNNNPFTVTNEWKLYEFDITANRGDYQVIKINFGNCGEVWIDDIEYGEYSANVAPVHATGVTLDKTSASVKQGKTITLTATVEPADAVNKNVTWSSNNASVATVSNGVVTGVATGNAKITITTEDGSHTASCTVTVTTSLPPLLISDFENTDDISEIIYPNVNESDRKEHIHIDLIDDPKAGGKCVAISDGNHKDTEYSIIEIPDAAKKYSILAFDIYYPGDKYDADGYHEHMNYKTIPVSLTYKDGKNQDHKVDIAEYHTPVFPVPAWDTKLINITGKIPADATSIKVNIGPINSSRAQLYLDNIRVKENPDDVEDYKQDEDLSDIWWKVEDYTLYIRGNGVIPQYTGSKKCPWADKTNIIKHVVVSEGITGIGNYSVGNSERDDVDITLHSIPEYFGEKCLKREFAEYLTRTLHLELWDAEKPFIAKSKSTYFPTFNTAKYYRNVTNTYSTVCLPFPVAEKTVTDAGAELFDFTSIEKNGEQYTLAFSKHSGDMVAGQTYLVKNHNINGTLQNTDVTKEQFNLTPSVSKNTIENSDPSFSISMTGVFQPSVFGPNLGTKDAPVYAYGFLNEKFYMNGGNMSVRPMRGYFKGSQLYSAPGYGEQQQPGAKKMPKMFNFEIVPDIVTHISSPAFIAEDFNIEEVYSPSGMKTESLNKGLNIIRTSTGRVLKVMVK